MLKPELNGIMFSQKHQVPTGDDDDDDDDVEDDDVAGDDDVDYLYSTVN